MKSRLRRYNIVLTIVYLAALSTACSFQVELIQPKGANPMVEISDIPHNSVVEWSGTRFGLLPMLPEKVEEITKEGEAIVPALLAALADPDLFVAAHVLLTIITNIRFETFPTWNGLEVDLQANGTVNIEADQRQELTRRWRLYFQTEPRLDMLPK